MTPKQFDRFAGQMFGSALVPAGFSTETSHRCTFYRKVSKEVYHVVMPDLGSRGAWYDVKVFPASPLIDPLFDSRFPDDLGIPTDRWSYLGEHGVGLDQQKFNCKSEDNCRHRFEASVRPLLVEKAIPYLDGIRTVDDMIPLIRHPLPLGFALYHVGRFEESHQLFQEQEARLSHLNSSDNSVVLTLQRIRELLGEWR
jgi:hypothetical protein